MLLAQWTGIWAFTPLIIMLLILFVVGFVILYGIGQIIKEAKKSTGSFRDRRYSQPRKPRTKVRAASTTQTIQLAMCPECEATILAEAVVCPHCGAPRPVCLVCHHSIEFADSVLFCPHCKGQAHRIHFLEYLKVKGTCPNCQSDLDEHELTPKMSLNSTGEN